MIHEGKKPNAVLWWAALGFAALFTAWTTLFVIAAHHRVAEVPVVTRGNAAGN